MLRFGAQPRDISPNGDRVRDFSPRGLRPLRGRRGAVLGDRQRGRGGAPAGGRPPARRRPQVPLPLVRPRRRGQAAARRRSTACGSCRREEGRVVDSIKEVRVDTRPPRVSIASVRAERGRAGRLPGGAHPLPRARATRRRSSASSAPTTTCRAPPGCSAATTPAPGCGTAPSAAAGSRPRASYSFNVKVRDLAGNKTEAPAAIPEFGDAPPRTGVAVRALTLQGPARRGARRLARGAARSDRAERRFEFALSRLGSGGPSARTAAAAGGCACAYPATPAPASTWCGCGSQAAGVPCGRWRWRDFRRAAPAGRPRPIVVLARRHMAGQEPIRLRPRRLPRHPRRGERRAGRAPFEGGALPYALPHRGVAADSLPRPRAAAVRPHHRPLARPPRGSGDRQRTGRGDRRHRASGCRGACATACSRRSRSVACPSRHSGASRYARRSRSMATCCATQARRARTTSSASAPASSSPIRPRRCARSPTSSACSGSVDAVLWRVLGVRALGPPAARRRAATSAGPRGGRAGVRRIPARTRAR